MEPLPARRIKRQNSTDTNPHFVSAARNITQGRIKHQSKSEVKSAQLQEKLIPLINGTFSQFVASRKVYNLSFISTLDLM